MFQLQGKMFYISCKILQRMKHTQQKPSFMDPEAWLLFIFRPKRLNFIIRRLIIILIYYTPYADVEPSQEQIHLCNTAKVWVLCIYMLCLSIYISMPYLFISIYYRVLPSFNSSQLTSDRLTHLSSFTLEQTVPRGRGRGAGGWPRHKATAELTGSGVHLNGLLCLPVFPQVITAADSRQREWMGFIPMWRFHLSDHSRS